MLYSVQGFEATSSFVTALNKAFSFATKEAWAVLQTTYEGTKVVKDSKLQRLTTSFKEIKMEKDESFNEFYAKLKDIIKLNVQSWGNHS